MPTANRDYLWPVSRERAYYYTLDRPYSNPDLLAAIDRVDKVKILKDEGDVKKRYIKADFFAKTVIPGPLQNLLKPNMLGWLQEQWWDGNTWTCKIKVTPHFMANAVKITSEFSLVDNGNGTTTQKFSLSANCMIPLLGPILAKEIINQSLASTEKQTRADIELAKKEG